MSARLSSNKQRASGTGLVGALWALTALLALTVGLKLLTVIVAGAAGDTDLSAYAAAAANLRAGAPIYWLPIVQGADPPNYLYPPPLALVFTLLGPYRVAWWAWAIFSLACWVGALTMIIRELREPLGRRLGARGWPLLVAALAVFPPVTSHLIWGQVGLPILLCLAAGWRALRRGRDGLAGVLLGLAIVLKVYPAVLCLPLLVRWRWRALVAAGAVAAALVGGGFAAVGSEQTAFYLGSVLPAAAAHAAGDPGNYALRELLPPLPFALAALVILAIVALAALRAGPAEAYTLGVTAILLISPVVWAHYFVLALLPWLAALARASRAELAGLAAAFAAVAAASAVFYVPLALVPLAHSLPTLGCAGLFAIQAAQVLRGSAGPAGGAE